MTFTITGGTIQLSGNAIEIVAVTTAPEMVGKDKYKIALKITCAGLIGSPFVDEIAPDTAYTSKFDISGIVDQPIDTVFQFPATGVSQANTALERTITIESGEVYTDANGDRVETWNEDDEDIRVLVGKLRPYDLGLLNDATKSFKTEYIDDGKFLTNLPSPIKVLPAQIVKLWWMNPYGVQTNASWKCQVTGQSGEDVDVFDITGECILYPETGLMEFNVNPAFLGFGVTVGVGYTPLSFRFWLISGGIAISEIRDFTVDNRYHEKYFLFLYTNSFSVVDCINLTAKYTESLKTASETATRPIPSGSGSKVAGLKTVSASGQRSWAINTGWKSVSELQKYRDFLESKERWMILSGDLTKLIPVVIESGDFVTDNSDADFIPNFEIKILEAHI